MYGYERRLDDQVIFHEDEVKLAKNMMDKLRTTVEFLYYLMEHRGLMSFTMIMLSADDLQLEHLLQKWKRKSDVLIEVDAENNVYVLICQATDREGGKKFAEILMSNIHMHGSPDAYCVETEFKGIKHSIQEVIFNMVEEYIYIKQEKKCNEVFFTKFDENNKIDFSDSKI